MPPRGEDLETSTLSATTKTTRRSSFSSFFHRRHHNHLNSSTNTTSHQQNLMRSHNSANTTSTLKDESHTKNNNENVINFSHLELEKSETNTTQASQNQNSSNLPLHDVDSKMSPSCLKKRSSFGNASTSSTTSTSTTSSSSSSNEQSCTPNTSFRKSVKFESLHIRTFIRVLGDHPCCSTGLPVTFGWNPVEDTTIYLDDYETSRSPRRSRKDMKLDDTTRKDILSSNCYPCNHEREESERKHDDYRENCNNDDATGTYDEVLSKIDLKRAERRLHRNRQRIRRRVIAQNFFHCPME